ncbi:MAG: YciI family protein [Ideonella sp.]|nr:YciI family protein [Ideonella sp.]MBL0151372.1 YciI family protein [Ideonella sp.]
MQYMLMIHGDEAAQAALPEAAVKELMGAYGAYAQAMAQAGVLVGGERLRPSDTATRVRVVAGKTQVLDGPYAESKEQLGGYYLINVPDLDQAITWAARCPSAAHGTIEVRPIWAM